MRRENPLITQISVAAATATLIGYALIAESTDFHLITLQSPLDSVIYHRASECIILWTILWSVSGWIRVLRRKPMNRIGRLRLIALVPGSIGFLQALSKTCAVYHDYRIEGAQPQSTSGWIDFVIFCAPLVPFLIGALLSVLLLGQIRVWRRLMTVGVCRGCGYDLTGNVSGVCPECGTPAGPKSS